MNDHIARNVTLRPVASAARIAVVMLLLAGAVWVVRAVWEIRLAVAGEPASGPPDQGGGTYRPPTALEDSYDLVLSIGGGVVLLCAVAFLSWLWRVRDNARVLSGQKPKYLGFWVYLGWIVPIANLWVPRGLVVDVHRASDPERPAPLLLNVWWVLWLIGTFSGVGMIYEDGKDQVIARAYSDIGTLLASDAALIGAAVAGALMVRRVTEAQRRRAATWTPPAADVRASEPVRP
ncbi:DUF4328 domain-containing protein [Streptomyces brasiliensis]|uniref:DUF4328 domain-containing protein n=1 Tax=Streptomyces brasiliensis TaxID=1954 RepID=A0A917NQN5_9ACTN|nr:DUF4328 domain-containing protein [Streptomyces brasiliensis]GGJ16225.1 hypothetical protein GCM10010121_028660 [Streptomyces brasiliensis]